ncbi:hypothetical protein JYU12_02905, partial [bacterium AH-315-K03]|nr:hypothetical protein [bacterium AH-315-K03]
ADLFFVDEVRLMRLVNFLKNIIYLKSWILSVELKSWRLISTSDFLFFTNIHSVALEEEVVVKGFGGGPRLHLNYHSFGGIPKNGPQQHPESVGLMGQLQK